MPTCTASGPQNGQWPANDGPLRVLIARSGAGYHLGAGGDSARPVSRARYAAERALTLPGRALRTRLGPVTCGLAVLRTTAKTAARRGYRRCWWPERLIALQMCGRSERARREAGEFDGAIGGCLEQRS